MKLVDKKEMSKWAFIQCKNGNDSEEMRDLITSPEWIYAYYVHIKSREEMKNKVSDVVWKKILKEVRFVFNDVDNDCFFVREIDLSHCMSSFNDYVPVVLPKSLK